MKRLRESGSEGLRGYCYHPDMQDLRHSLARTRCASRRISTLWYLKQLKNFSGAIAIALEKVRLVGVALSSFTHGVASNSTFSTRRATKSLERIAQSYRRLARSLWIFQGFNSEVR